QYYSLGRIFIFSYYSFCFARIATCAGFCFSLVEFWRVGRGAFHHLGFFPVNFCVLEGRACIGSPPKNLHFGEKSSLFCAIRLLLWRYRCRCNVLKWKWTLGTYLLLLLLFCYCRCSCDAFFVNMGEKSL
ncbi:unnamed protein product, partial [Laminaria digitata]